MASKYDFGFRKKRAIITIIIFIIQIYELGFEKQN